MEEMVLQWRGKSFKIWITEEMGDWLPDFLAEGDGTVPEKTPEVSVRPGSSYDRDGCNIGNVVNEETKILDTHNLRNDNMDGGNPNENISHDCMNVGHGNLKKGSTKGKNCVMEETLSSDIKGAQGPRKRFKKIKRVQVGLVQSKLLSRDERPTGLKRPRMDFDPNGLDPFGLDAILGLNVEIRDKNTDTEGDILIEEIGDKGMNGEESLVVERIDLDLNNQPVVNSDEENNEDDIEVEDGTRSNGCEEDRIEKEIEATVDMGEKLGVQLNNFQPLVEDAIQQEGLQVGNL